MIQIAQKILQVFTLSACLIALALPAAAREETQVCGLNSAGLALAATVGAAETPNKNADTASEHAHHAAGPQTGTPLDFFTNYGNYMPRVHCLSNEAGAPDWPWIIALLVLTTTVVVGYLRIFVFWRRAYLDEAPEDRNKKMMQLAYIFLFCAVCGYAFSIMAYFWPAYRLLAVMMVILNVVTWSFALSLKDFRLSLSAKRLNRELEEHAQTRTEELERLVAERTAALDEVREQTRQLALVASKTDNAVIITDAQGKITWVNASFSRITGYAMDEAIGKKPGRLLQGPDTDPQTVARIREAIANEQPIHEEILNYTKDGRPYWLDIEIQPIRDDNGIVTHFMAMESDITRDIAINEELTQAKEQAESANRAKSQFIANMSHEIRTPLTGIIGFAELLAGREQVDKQTRQDWSHSIVTSGRHLQMLLNDVLDISKIEAGKLEIELLRVRPHEVIAEIASIFRVNAAHKGLALEIDCPNPLPETIQTDPTRLRQVLSNLVGNAIKFTEKGSIRIEADVEMTDDDRELLRIDVVDTGPGMTDEQQGRLFKTFAQADASVTRKFGGTGLGLVISRHLSQALGGDLRVESRAGFGSRFIVTIDPGDLSGCERVVGRESQTIASGPVAVPEIDAPAQRAAVTSDPARTDDLPLGRILLADDGETNRKFFSITLQDAGYAVTSAENGRAALDTLLAEPDAFDLVLMDMQMPEMDGFEATRRAREAGVTCPIYALTASVLKGDRERCLAVGCNDYLSKPIKPTSLVEAVEQVLRGASATGDTSATPEAVAANDNDAPAPAETSDPIPPGLDGSTPDFIDFVSGYANELTRYVAQARDALEADDTDALAAIAHKILGSGGTMGYDCLTEPAAALQSAAHERAIQQANAQVQALTDLCTRIQAGIDELRTQDSASL